MKRKNSSPLRMDRSSSSRIPTAAGYFRVSTGQQDVSDLSIPDQRRQVQTFCDARGILLVAEYVDHGLTATDDKRPELQRLIERATDDDRPYDYIIFHSYSRFFRDAFQQEFYIRKLAKAGVRTVSITQEHGDAPSGDLIRRVIALFDEYQSKEISKHVMRSMKENARQGFHNGSHPPFGYRTVEAERRGMKVKKRLEIDPVEAETVRMIYSLYLNGDKDAGQLGMKKIVDRLNRAGFRTRNNGYFGTSLIDRILKNPAYKGEFVFNRHCAKTREEKPPSETIIVPIPAIVTAAEFDEVQLTLQSRHREITPPRSVSGPILLTGLTFCASCGGGMTLRTGTSKTGHVHRYYSCSQAQKKGDLACKGRYIPIETLDRLVVEHLCDRLLTPERVGSLIESVAVRRQRKAAERDLRICTLRKELQTAEEGLSRLYKAIEQGVAELDDLLTKRIETLKLQRQHAQAALERIGTELVPAEVSEEMITAFTRAMKENITSGGIIARKAYIRSIVQSIEVGDDTIKIIGQKNLLEDAIRGSKRLTSGVRSSEPNWCGWRDSNPHALGART